MDAPNHPINLFSDQNMQPVLDGLNLLEVEDDSFFNYLHWNADDGNGVGHVGDGVGHVANGVGQVANGVVQVANGEHQQSHSYVHYHEHEGPGNPQENLDFYRPTPQVIMLIESRYPEQHTHIHMYVHHILENNLGNQEGGGDNQEGGGDNQEDPIGIPNMNVLILRVQISDNAPQFRNILNQEEETASGNLQKPIGNSRIVKNTQEITTARKPQPWWKKNVRKEMEDRILMPPPPPRQPSAVNKKLQVPEKPVVIQEEFKRKLDFPEENEQELPFKKRKFKHPEVHKKPARKLEMKGPARKGGEDNGFLFVSSENESEDDFVTLKFLTVYVLNGGNLAPKFGRPIVNFINEKLAENCKITVSKYRNKVVELRRKFLHLVEENGGEDFTEADFPTGLDYEMAQMCKIVWRDKQESGGFGSFAGPKSNVGRGRDEVKLVGEIGRRAEGIKLGGAGVIVDQGNRGGADLRVDLDHGNGAGADMRMNINQGNEAGAEQRVNIDQGNGSGADTGVNIGHGNGAGSDQGRLNIDHGNGTGANQGVDMDYGIGARADQKKDSIMDIDEKPVGLSDTLTIKEHNARDGTPRPWKVYSRRPNLTKVSKKGPQGSTTGGV